MSSEADFARLLPAWLKLTSRTDVALGLEPSEALGRAKELLRNLRLGRITTEGWTVDAERTEVLHALVALACRDTDSDAKAALAAVELVIRHISSLPWPADFFGGPRELLARCAFQGWRIARRFAKPPEIEIWLGRVRATSELFATAEHALAIPRGDREALASELRLDDPELLLCISELVRSQLESAPSVAHDEAAFFYRFVEQPVRQIGLHDEREYFLGELALTAGTASRFLFRTDEARLWFQRAEVNFALVQNANAHWARLAYQRLALLIEERKLEQVLELAPMWASTFARLEMPEDALKCRFLEGIARWERGDARRAIEIHAAICTEAETLHSPRLVALAANNLVTYFADAGETEKALEYARKALPVLQQLSSRVHLVKLQWSMGDLFRKQGDRAAALEAYRQALADAAELGMRGDVAAIHLVVADLLLEAGQEAQAEWEIRAALPIIDEEKMVPEGIAALSLLRESLRRRQIDKQALRELHGYFQEK